MIATRRTLRIGIVTLLGLLAAGRTSSLAHAQAGIAPNGDAGAGFDVEGDLQANTPHANTTDWVAGSGGNGIALMSDPGVPFGSNTFHVVDAFDLTDRVFSIAGTNRLNNNPNGNWVWVTNVSPADKDNLNHGLVHLSTDANGHHWITWAVDRKSANGTSSIDCGLWQGSLVRNGDGTFTSNGPHNGRTVGDLLLNLQLIDLGTQLPLLTLSRWSEISPGVYDYVGLTPAAGTAFAGCNVGVTTPVPYTAFGSATYVAAGFGEGAVDLTALLAAIQPGAQFQTVFFSNRSSQSPSAALKDFIDPIAVAITTGVGDGEAGAEIGLTRIAPNPASGPVRMEFVVTHETHVRLGIFDVTGRQVAALANGVFPPGRHVATWDARKDSPASAAGVYFVRFQGEGHDTVRRFALIR
jgi:hypothetical protein